MLEMPPFETALLYSSLMCKYYFYVYYFDSVEEYRIIEH